MSSKYEGKLWLLESNQERVFDEYADPSELARQPAMVKSQKTLIRTIKKSEGIAPDELYPVALVFEHHYEGEQYPKDGMHDTYAAPLFGYELLQQLEGRLLDYVDATYADIEQRKSQKRILRRILWEFRGRAVDTNAKKFGNADLIEPEATN